MYKIGIATVVILVIFSAAGIIGAIRTWSNFNPIPLTVTIAGDGRGPVFLVPTQPDIQDKVETHLITD